MSVEREIQPVQPDPATTVPGSKSSPDPYEVDPSHGESDQHSDDSGADAEREGAG